MVEHRSLVNRAAWQAAAFGLGARRHGAADAPRSRFDASVWELWTPLATRRAAGAARVRSGAGPGVIAAQPSCEGGVTVAQFVPTAAAARCSARSRAGGSLPCRSVFCGGEPLAGRAGAREARAAGAGEVVNLYGPTEATIDSHLAPVRRGRARARPSGVRSPTRGSTCWTRGASRCRWAWRASCTSAGAGVARGYLDRPELTAERFVADPFAADRARGCTARATWARWLAGRDDRVPGAQRLPGEDPRLPHRAGRDRGAAGWSTRACARRWCWRARTRRETSGWWRTSWAPDAVAADALRAHLCRAAAGVHGAGGVRAAGGAAADAEREAGPQGAAGAGGRRLRARGSTRRRVARSRRRWPGSGRSCWAWSGWAGRQLLRAGRPLAAGGAGRSRGCGRRWVWRWRSATSSCGRCWRTSRAGWRRAARRGARRRSTPRGPRPRRSRCRSRSSGCGSWSSWRTWAATYHIALAACGCEGELDRGALAARAGPDRGAPRGAAHHFAAVDGEPVQRIAPAEESRFHLVEHDLSGHAGRGGASCAG